MWQRRFHFPLATFTSFLLVARAQQHRPRYVPGFVSFIQSSTPEVNFPVSNPQNVCSVAFFVVVVVVVVVVFRWNSHSVSILTKKKDRETAEPWRQTRQRCRMFFFYYRQRCHVSFFFPPQSHGPPTSTSFIFGSAAPVGMFLFYFFFLKKL